MRIIKHVLSNDGQDFGNHLVLVPLDNSDSPPYATVDVNDFYYLIDNRCSKRWSIDRTGNVVLWGAKGKRPCQVKRLITGAGAGQGVSFKNGNRLDLRRNNLEIVEDSRAIHNEWDFINLEVNRPYNEVTIIHHWEFRPPMAVWGHLSFIGHGDTQPTDIPNYGRYHQEKEFT